MARIVEVFPVPGGPQNKRLGKSLPFRHFPSTATTQIVCQSQVLKNQSNVLGGVQPQTGLPWECGVFSGILRKRCGKLTAKTSFKKAKITFKLHQSSIIVCKKNFIVLKKIFLKMSNKNPIYWVFGFITTSKIFKNGSQLALDGYFSFIL